MAISRRDGVLLDRDHADYQLALRGANQRRWAQESGVPEPTISRALNGRRIREETLRKLTTGLLGIPLMVGADLLVAMPEKKIAGASTSPATSAEEASSHASSAT